MLQIVYKHEKELPHRTCVISGEQELNGVVSLLTKRSLALHLDCVWIHTKDRTLRNELRWITKGKYDLI